MTIEQRLAEIIRAFCADALSSTVNLNVDLDVVLCVLAQALLAAFRDPARPRLRHRHPRHPPAALPRHRRNHHQRRRHHHRHPQPPRLLTRPAPVRPPRRHHRPLVAKPPPPLPVQLAQGRRFAAWKSALMLGGPRGVHRCPGGGIAGAIRAGQRRDDEHRPQEPGQRQHHRGGARIDSPRSARSSRRPSPAWETAGSARPGSRTSSPWRTRSRPGSCRRRRKPAAPRWPARAGRRARRSVPDRGQLPKLASRALLRRIEPGSRTDIPILTPVPRCAGECRFVRVARVLGPSRIRTCVALVLAAAARPAVAPAPREPAPSHRHAPARDPKTGCRRLPAGPSTDHPVTPLPGRE